VRIVGAVEAIYLTSIKVIMGKNYKVYVPVHKLAKNFQFGNLLTIEKPVAPHSFYANDTVPLFILLINYFCKPPNLMSKVFLKKLSIRHFKLFNTIDNLQ